MATKRAASLGTILLLWAGPSILSGCAARAQEACGETMTMSDDAQRHVTVLAEDLAPLRDRFDAMSDRWRVVSVVSPTCSECVLGAEAVEREVTSRYPANQVAALTVWIPMLPSDDEAAANASATIFPAGRASQYYDSRQRVGWEYARGPFAGFAERARRSLPAGHWLTGAFEDRAEAERPQWDLYMLYAPGVRWGGQDDAPPMPTHWLRHVGRMEDRETSTYWRDTPDSGPREGDLFEAIRAMADQAIGAPGESAVSATIEVLGFEGCPNTPRTRQNVERALARLGLAADVVYVDQERLPELDRRRGWPAPTVLVDGRDLFGLPAPASPAMGCRVYAHGAPSIDEIEAALQSLTHP